jgi:hypothetical protein
MLSTVGGLGTAKRLLATTEASTGFTALYERGRLDLTVEALVVKSRFESLFTDQEIETARQRLTSSITDGRMQHPDYPSAHRDKESLVGVGPDLPTIGAWLSGTLLASDMCIRRSRSMTGWARTSSSRATDLVELVPTY